jgi:hypothetical protein
VSFSTSFLIPSQLTIASKAFAPHSSSSVSVFLSPSACRAAFFAAALAAGHNVDHLGASDSSGSSSGGDSHMLLSLLLLSGSAAAATLAAALIAAGRNVVNSLGDSGGSGGCDSSSLSARACTSYSLMSLSSGNPATDILCCRGGCRHLRLWLVGCLLCLNVPILRGLLKRLVLSAKQLCRSRSHTSLYLNAVHALTTLIAPTVLDLLSLS